MAYCPNCSVAIAKDAEDCDVCGTGFDRWLPLDSLPRRSRRPATATLIFGMGLAAVLLPLAGCVAGLFITVLTPGCYCDASWGCAGCGANSLTELLFFGGWDTALIALLFVFPAAALLAAVAAFFSRRSA